jgi:hypothetical protein
MSMLLLLMFLIGAVLGMRFRVLVLIPAIGFLFMASLAACVMRAESLSITIAAIVLTVCCLQIGYLGGIVTRYATALADSSRLRRGALKSASRPLVPPAHSTGGAPSTAYRG